MSEQYTPDPFGYFKPEPFGWTDCAESDDDAIPLYDKFAIKLIEKQRDKLSAEVEELKLIIATDTGTESAVAAMQKQRDELLAALEAGRRLIELISPFEGDVTRQMDKAIARVKANT